MSFIFLVLSCWCEANSLPDSLRKEVIDGKVFVIHQVDPKETLYGLSKRYRVPIAQILQFNNKANSGLHIGQIVKIPVDEPMPTDSLSFHTAQPNETIYSIANHYNVSVDALKSLNEITSNVVVVGQKLRIPPPNKNIPSSKPVEGHSEGLYQVKQGETLYALAHRYNTTVTELKQWNNLTENALSVGQMIRISGPPSATTAIKTPQNNPISISENITGSDEIVESGLATLMDGGMGKRKYLAWHHKAPKGTILKIRNTQNGLEAFVRVIGTLPDAKSKEYPIIKISQSAFNRLKGTVDTPIKVEITYYK